FHRHPISQSVGIIRSDQDMICADHAFKILDGIYPIHQVVEIEVLEITARRLRSGERLSSAAPFESLVKTTEMVRKKTASMEQPELEFGKPVEHSAVTHKADRQCRVGGVAANGSETIVAPFFTAPYGGRGD